VLLIGSVRNGKERDMSDDWDDIARKAEEIKRKHGL
jgi:hypothetical protein